MGSNAAGAEVGVDLTEGGTGAASIQCAFLEFYVAQYPVNQWIVVGEPTMSKY